MWAMFASGWVHRCHRPACCISRPSPPATFRTCGGCRFANYCSRGCQKAAWKTHRAMCRMYKACAAAPGTYEDLDAVRCASVCAFADEELENASLNLKLIRATQIGELREHHRFMHVLWTREIPIHPQDGWSMPLLTFKLLDLTVMGYDGPFVHVS